MNKFKTGARNQKGVAVIIALLLTTLAITIVASLFWQQQVQVRSIENQRLQLQIKWILRGALDWAGLILREDSKHSNVDSLDEPWATPLAETRLDQYVEEGNKVEDISDTTLSGSISDAQARYNLNNLSVNGNVNAGEVATFGKILELLKRDPRLAQGTADEISSYQKSMQGKEGGDENRIVPLLMKITQVEDLLAIQGFTPEMIEKLKDYVIFLPIVTAVNINTASAEVLSARVDNLSFPDATALVESRNKAYFRDLGDFTNRLHRNSLALMNNRLSVSSNFFLVNGKVRMRRAELRVQALIERINTNTRLIWVKEL